MFSTPLFVPLPTLNAPATRFLVHVPYTCCSWHLRRDDISLHPPPIRRLTTRRKCSSFLLSKEVVVWRGDRGSGCRDKRGGEGAREAASRALSCGGDIALLEPALISRHLQFSPPAIHPYFASRHASPNERLCSLRPAPSPAPPYPGVTG